MKIVNIFRNQRYLHTKGDGVPHDGSIDFVLRDRDHKM